MPKKIGGGGKLQDYDERNGEYDINSEEVSGGGNVSAVEEKPTINSNPDGIGGKHIATEAEKKRLKELGIGYKEKSDKGAVEKKETAENKFIPAKTTQEAEQFAKNNLKISGVNYKGIDIEVANAMNEAIQRGFAICPKIKDKLMYVGNAQKVNTEYRKEYAQAATEYTKKIISGLSDNNYKKLGQSMANKAISKVKSNSIAFSIMGKSSIPEINKVMGKYRGILANENLCKNAQKLKSILEYNKSIGFLSEGTLKGTFDHEVAHRIDHALGLRNKEEMVKLFNSYSTEVIGKGLSRYGAKNIGEFIAEGWAEYCNSKKPREIAQKIGEIIEKELKE